MLDDARLASEFADEMLEKGIYVIGFSYPVVPRGEIFQQSIPWILCWLVCLHFLPYLFLLSCNYANYFLILVLCVCVCNSNYCVCVVTGEARIRVQISAVHSQTDLDQCLEAFIEIGKRKHVIPWVRVISFRECFTNRSLWDIWCFVRFVKYSCI